MQALKGLQETIDNGVQNNGGGGGFSGRQHLNTTVYQQNNAQATPTHQAGGHISMSYPQEEPIYLRDIKLNENRQSGSGCGVFMKPNTDWHIIKKQIELKNGRVLKAGQFRHQSNALKLYRYYLWKGVWFFIVDALANWDNLFCLLFIAFIFLAGDDIAMTPYFPVVIFLLNILVQGVINMIADLKIRNACKEVNHRRVKKFVFTQKHNNRSFQHRTWEQLKPGDIIKISENEEFPADVMILDVVNSTNDHKCYVRGGYTDDFSVPTLKQSHERTHNKTGIKMSAAKFVKQISGVINYEFNLQSGHFTGSFKHDSDYKALPITLENIVVRGSNLINTKSAICLVLNVEQQPMNDLDRKLGLFDHQYDAQYPSWYSGFRLPMLVQLFKTRKPNFETKYYKPMRILQLILILIYIGASSVSFIQLKLSTTSQQHRFVKIATQFFNSSQINDEIPQYIKWILALISGLFISLPLNFKIIMDLITIINSNFAEWDYNLAPSNLKINNAFAIKALGNITNVFMSKNAIINHNIKKAKVFQVQETWYYDNDLQDQQQINHFGNSGADHSPTFTLYSDVSVGALIRPIPTEQKDQPNIEQLKNLKQRSSFRNYAFPKMNSKEAQLGSTEIGAKISKHSGPSTFNPRRHIADEGISLESVLDLQQNINNADEDDVESLEDYLPNVVEVNQRFHNHKIKKDLHFFGRENKDYIKEMFKAVVICHQASRLEPHQIQINKSVYKSIHSEEEAHLMVAHSYDYQFLNRHNKSISHVNNQTSQMMGLIDSNGQTLENSVQVITIGIGVDYKEHHEIMVTHTFYHQNEQPITVTVIKPEPLNQQSNDNDEDQYLFKNGGTLYAKGPMSLMLQYLNETDEISALRKHKYLEDLQQYAQLGLCPTMFMKKDLDVNGSHFLEKLIQDAMQSNDKIEAALLHYMQINDNHDMNGLEVLGIIGTQSIFNIRDSFVIEDLVKNDITVWMLSKEDEIEHTIDCNLMRLIDSSTSPLHIDGHSERDVQEQINRALSTIAEGQEFDAKGKLKYSSNKEEKKQVTPGESKLKQQEGKKKKKKHTHFIDQQYDFNNKADQKPLLQDEQQDKRLIIMITGSALNFILRDETLLKTFLTIASFSDLILGSSIKPMQQAEIIHCVKNFYSQDPNNFTIALISSAQEQYMMKYADITVVLSTNFQKQSTLQIRGDIVMNSIYPLTYLLFKHGTTVQRRIQESIKIILYMTIFLGLIIGTFMVVHGFTASLPVKNLMLIMFCIMISSVQIVLFGISYRDVAFDYLHRIYGEYHRNFVTHLFDRYDLIKVAMLAIFDTVIFHLVTFEVGGISVPKLGKHVNQDGIQLYYGIIMYVFLTFQLTNQNEVVNIYRISFFFLNILGVIFILDDEYLTGIKQAAQSPILLLHILYVILICISRNYFLDVIRKLIWSAKHYDFYLNIEDHLFLEEYEDPNQEFSLQLFDKDYQNLTKILSQRKMAIINQNLMKLPRSEQLESIIEKLNEQHQGQSMKKFQDKAILNWFSLKFNDYNKELEYIESRFLEKVNLFKKVLWLTLGFNLIEIIKEIIFSSLKKIPFQSFWFYFGFGIENLIILLFLYKFQNKAQLVNFVLLIFQCFFFTICYYYIDFIEFSLCVPILVFIFILHGTYVRLIVALASSFLIIQVIVIKSNFTRLYSDYKNLNIEMRPFLVFPFLTTILALFVISFSLYIYWEEKTNRLDYWQTYKKFKDYQKLKSILNILMPPFVRERVREGHGFIADDQREVSLIFCDIGEFDQIVQMFSGRELCEWLDSIYQTFDQFCEQHGLFKIETVGKTYMACAGLKVNEKKVDERLQEKHHSVRVMEFAQDILMFIKRQQLKDGSSVKVKIGIHTGQVISGVVGLNKPQFSLIGDTVNKTSRVCSKCKDNEILISKETYNLLPKNSDLYDYDGREADMKGIGKENVYSVKKRSNLNHQPLPLPSSTNRKQSSHFEQRNRQMQKYNEELTRRRTKQLEIEDPKKTTNINGTAFFGGRPSPMNQQQRGLPQSNLPNPFRSSGFGINEGQAYQDTSRSLISDQNSGEIGSYPNEFNNSFEEEIYTDKYYEPNQSNKEQVPALFREFKDDRLIFKNKVDNMEYKCIERPKYLITFHQNHGNLEDEFRFQMLKEEMWRKYIFMFLMFAMYALGFAFFLLESKYELNAEETKKFWIPLYIYIGILLIWQLVIIIRLKYANINSYKQIGYLLSGFFIFQLCGTGVQAWNMQQDSRIMQIYVIETMIIMSFCLFFKMLQLRLIIVIYTSMIIIWIVVFAGNVNHISFKSYSYMIELIFVFAILLIMNHSNEMTKRKSHNRKLIIDVETKKTNDLLNNLVPPPVLQGIKNDQKVLDELSDVTLLFTDMVGFTQFSNNVRNPTEVVKLLSDLFTRFDQLCMDNNVYKVHTIGDCYVILGYTGHIPQSQRTPQIKAEEAYQVIKTGFQMIDHIADLRKRSENPDLKELNMRIGIHTGKIVAGIIGTKIVRYDIFGSDVLVANKMESHGMAGEVVISEDTKNILQYAPELAEKLYFEKHKLVELHGINRDVESYKVHSKDMKIGSNSSIRYEDSSEESIDNSRQEEDSDSSEEGKEA